MTSVGELVSALRALLGPGSAVELALLGASDPAPLAHVLLAPPELELHQLLREAGGVATLDALCDRIEALAGVTPEAARAAAEPMLSLLATSDAVSLENLGIVLSRERFAEAIEALGAAPNVYAHEILVGYDVLASHRDPPADVFVRRNEAAARQKDARRAQLAEIRAAAERGGREAVLRAVAASYGLDDALDVPALDEQVAVCKQAQLGRFALVRSPRPEPGNSGWFVGCGNLDHAHDAASVELTSIGELEQARPSLARFLGLPPGALVSFDDRPVPLVVYLDDDLLSPATGSWLDEILQRGAEGDELPSELVQAAKDDDEALRLVAEHFLSSRFRAERRLEALRRETKASSFVSRGAELDRALLELAATRGKVAAVLHCKTVGMGLAEAKAYVEALLEAKGA